MNDCDILLTKALHSNNINTLKSLVKNENFSKPIKASSLHIKNAITMNSKEALEYVIDNPSFNTNMSLMHIGYCVERGNKEILELFLKSNFVKEMNTKELKDFKETLLFSAIHGKHIELIDFFINDIVKNDPFYKIKQFISSLGFHSINDNHFINLKKITNDDFARYPSIYLEITPILRVAAFTNDSEVFHHILNHPHLKHIFSLNEEKNSYLLLFTFENCLSNISQYLIKNHTYNIHLNNHKKQNIFELGLQKDNEKSLDLILNDVKYNNEFHFEEYYDNLLTGLAERGHTNLLKQIISKIENFDINKKYYDDKTLLEISYKNFYYDNNETIKYLLTFPNIEINNGEHDNDTIFNYACNIEDEELIKTLLIDKDFKVDELIMEWLNGDNDSGFIYENTLDIIKKIELYHKLNSNIKHSINKNINKI